MYPLELQIRSWFLSDKSRRMYDDSGGFASSPVIVYIVPEANKRL